MVTPTSAASIPELFRAALDLLQQGEVKRAAAALDRVVALDPSGELAPAALFKAAEAYDASGDRQSAAARLEQLVRRHPYHPLARESLVRAVRLSAYLERWDRTGFLAELLLARYPGLRPFEGVVAYSGRALALVAAGDPERAAPLVEKGRQIVDEHQLDRAGRVPRDLAQLYFALGEIRRARAEAIRFSPLPSDFVTVLERRCQLLLDAQSAYSDAMRAFDAHWSAMAGYRVGELYQRLHEELMRIRPPAVADTQERRELFEGAMRLRYSVLLSKALTMMNHTLAMAERTQERSSWVERATRSRDEIQAAILREEAALDRLPYSRRELQDALDRLSGPPLLPATAPPAQAD